MLLGRFGVYGLTIYGGYGKKHGVVSFFAIGAVVGPIGGVPAFFVTGIGGGFGINRRSSCRPTCRSSATTRSSRRSTPAASAPRRPDGGAARARRRTSRPEPGTFWFAAGLSFNSFALVDGIAVVAMQFGDGFEFSLLGLARMALPAPAGRDREHRARARRADLVQGRA